MEAGERRQIQLYINSLSWILVLIELISEHTTLQKTNNLEPKKKKSLLSTSQSVALL